MQVNEEGTPLLPDGTPMSSFETKTRRAPGGGIENAIFIDGEELDWTVNMNDFMQAAKMGPKYLKAVKENIAKHFLESVSDVLGRHITSDAIKQANQTGWI